MITASHVGKGPRRTIDAGFRAVVPEGVVAWTSLQVNVNTVSDRHEDGRNCGLSFLMVLGGFNSGGELETKDLGKLALQDQVVLFDGTRPRCSHPFAGGDRVSLVAFRHPMANSLDQELLGQLKELGFPVAFDGDREPGGQTRAPRAGRAGGPG